MQVNHTLSPGVNREELARGCLIAAFSGVDLPEHTADALSRGLGGVVLLERNVKDLDQVHSLVERVHEIHDRALVLVDEEGGSVSRLARVHGGGFPPAHALGHIDDPNLTHDLARLLGASLRQLGVDICLAPVVDLAAGRGNPVVGTRSFGADPQTVSRHAVSVVHGLRSAGVASCAKHFPGHGLAFADSHEEVAVASAEEAVLIDKHLSPFIAAIAAGVDAVMPGHVVLPPWDDQPASGSRHAIGHVLRGLLGFDGLVVADAVDMAGVAGLPPEASLAVLRAGADLVLLGNRDHSLAEIEDVVTLLSREAEHDQDLSDQLAQAHRRRQLFEVPEESGLTPEDRRSEAARRAISLHGSFGYPRQPDQILILESEWMSEIGRKEAGVKEVAARALPGAEVISIEPYGHWSGADRALMSSTPSSYWMVVVADTAFQPRLVDKIARLRMAHQRLTIVETGIPAAGLQPPYVLLRGASDHSLRELAALLEAGHGG